MRLTCACYKKMTREISRQNYGVICHPWYYDFFMWMIWMTSFSLFWWQKVYCQKFILFRIDQRLWSIIAWALNVEQCQQICAEKVDRGLAWQHLLLSCVTNYHLILAQNVGILIYNFTCEGIKLLWQRCLDIKNKGVNSPRLNCNAAWQIQYNFIWLKF